MNSFRARFANAHGIPAERQFRSWEDIADRPPLAQALINATLERTHRASTLGLLAAGYEMLLEKPIATTPGECLEIAAASESHGRMLQIAHVLRYAPFFVALREIVTSGRLGAIVSVDSAYIVERTDASLGITAEDIDAQFQRMHENGQDCTSVRYLGSVGQTQFVFVLHHGTKDVWYVLTLSEDGQSIAKVE